MAKSFATIKAEAVVVRDESVANANTASRVGTVMVDTVDKMESVSAEANRTLDQVPNVDTTGKHGGDLLQWNATSSKWINISPRKLSMDGAGFLGFCNSQTVPPIFSGDEFEYVYYIYDAPIGESSLENIRQGLTFNETKRRRYFIIRKGTNWEKVADDEFVYIGQSDFFNVTASIPRVSGYYNLANAILAVYNYDSQLAHKGLVITFEESAENWVTYQCKNNVGFTGTNVWVQIPTREEVNLNTDAIAALRILGSVYKGVIASEAAASPTLGTSDRVHYTYNCAVGGALLANFGGLTLPASNTIKRYIISWNGSSWVSTADTVLLTSNIKNSLTETVAGNALDATQGKALNDTKVAISSIVDNLASTSATVPLSAKQGKTLHDEIVALSSAGYLYLGQATTATSPDVTDQPDNQKLYYSFDAPVGTSTFTEFFGSDGNALVLVNTNYPKRYLLMWSGVGYWVTVAETVMLGIDADCYNVTRHNPPISGYHSFPDVLLYIPEAMRAMEGLKIAFSTGANTWTNYQCINASAFTGSNGWVKLPTQIEVNSKVATSDIVDNLTSTNASVPLSAKQGKVLNDALAELDADIRLYKDLQVVFSIDANMNLLVNIPDPVNDEFSLNNNGELILTY